MSDDLNPLSLWGWKRTQALADAGKLKAPELVTDQLDPMSAAFAFVNQPAPDSGIEEKNPGECVPRAVADRRMLGYTLRNGGKDQDDIVTILAGFRHPGGEWDSAMIGEWRLAGLGAEWAVHPAGMAPHAPTSHILERSDCEPRERYAHFEPDGSGVEAIRRDAVRGAAIAAAPTVPTVCTRAARVRQDADCSRALPKG